MNAASPNDPMSQSGNSAVSTRKLILFADGTGNNGGYGMDTNVYKLYKAIDIHDPNYPQLTFYEQGVGTDESDTNKNKYYKAISGAFGFGFTRNVRNLYEFLARNYEEGDEIFLFGFSRGAATVRALVGLLNTAGLYRVKQSTDPDDDDTISKNIDKAFEIYRKRDHKILRKYESAWIKLKDATQKQTSDLDNARQAYEAMAKNQDKFPDVKIKCVGVWDTVSALGFPREFDLQPFKFLFESFENLADKIWPHRYFDYELNPFVENAFHALSIDDERKTFAPKFWNENLPGLENTNIQQVWFAGVHSNVGGGYPRTGLSDLALQWMIGKLSDHNLNLKLYPEQITIVEHGANLYDRLYNSRDGVAIFYRYGPRDLVKLAEGKTQKGEPIKFHHTVHTKLINTKDPYTPSCLPIKFDVVDNAGNGKTIGVESKNEAEWKSHDGDIRKYIKLRKHLYNCFFISTAVIVLAAMFWWKFPPQSVLDVVEGDVFFLNRWIGEFLKWLTPVMFDHFITLITEVCPFASGLIVLVVYYWGMWRCKNTLTKKQNVASRKRDLLYSEISKSS